ncbi:MAG: hypothetical protein WCH62_01035 [Candidatus Omnitrophota bacterium]
MERIIETVRNFFRNYQLGIVFSLGVLLRVIVFLFQGPFNKDDHYAVVKYIYTHHALPHSLVVSQSDHPPLYYILASLLYPLGVKAVQAFSLGLSIGALYIFYLLIKRLDFIRPLKVKKYGLLLACTLPQLVMFGNYISNDSLTFFIGACLFLQMFLYINAPTMSNLCILAIFLGVGLLTKGCFLAFVPILIILIIIVQGAKKDGWRKCFLSVAIFFVIFSVLGSYKYIENVVYFNRPSVLHIDQYQKWMKVQRPTYVGLESIFDINLFKLMKEPIASPSTWHSYPLLLYGTFWYQYIPESNFTMNMTGYKYLGSCIYLMALLPTILFTAGFFRILFSFRNVFGYNNSDRLRFNETLYQISSLGLFAVVLSGVFYLGIKYDVWSFFQSRYLFTTFFFIIILFNSGINYLEERWKGAGKIIFPWLNCLYFLFILYFAVEIFRGFSFCSLGISCHKP